jgi:hypothetical protein
MNLPLLLTLFLLAPTVAFSCAVAIALACHLARWPFDVRRKAMERDIDRLLQREWDLVNQVNAVTSYERVSRRGVATVRNWN